VTRHSKNIHLGELLQQVVDNSELSITQIIKRVGYKTRGSFYAHIANPDLSYKILAKYGRVLNYDFSQHIPHLNQQFITESEPHFDRDPKTLPEAIKQIDYWKDRYYELSEKYQKLLEKSLDL
jgi:hypothetical protein